MLLICAAAVVVVARRSRKTHGSSAGDSSTDLPFGEPALHSSSGDQVPLAVSPPLGQLQDRDQLTLGTPPMCYLPVSSQQRQSFMLIACLDFPRLYRVYRGCNCRHHWWCEVCLDGSNVASPINCFRQLPDAIQLVTSTVRSGLPVNEAFRTIAREMPQPTAGQFAIVCR